MKSKDYKSIDVPIKLRLDFDETTVGELSSILRQWQVLLRTAWRESYSLYYSGSAPNQRILVASASTKNSFEINTDFALQLAFVSSIFGPVRDWPAVARTTYRFLASVWTEKNEKEDTFIFSEVYIRGGESPELRVNADVLRDSETGTRIERLFEIAVAGGFGLAVEEPDDQDEGLDDEADEPETD